MGLAASQGRLLLLTARKSDLEYRAQEISQRRLTLASELETISAQYARKTANRQMKLAIDINQGETNQAETVNLTYKSLIDYGKDSDTQSSSIYRVKNARGQVVVSHSSELPKTAAQAGYPELPDSALRTEDGKVVINGVSNGEQIYVEFIVDTRLADASKTENYFQEGLRNGRFIIEQLSAVDSSGNIIVGEGSDNSTTTRTGIWQPKSWSGMSEILDNYYTDDDEYARADYQTASARVQAQDKKLETDQKQIETQHKAVETEFESVQKVIQSNIESSFKMFS